MDDFCRCGPLAAQLSVKYGSRQIKVQHILLEGKDGVQWGSIMGLEKALQRDQQLRLKLEGQGEGVGRWPGDECQGQNVCWLVKSQRACISKGRKTNRTI